MSLLQLGKPNALRCWIDSFEKIVPKYFLPVKIWKYSVFGSANSLFFQNPYGLPGKHNTEHENDIEISVFSRLGCDAFWTDQNSIKFPSANDTILFARKSKFQVEVHPPTMNFGRTGCWLSQTYCISKFWGVKKFFGTIFFFKTVSSASKWIMFSVCCSFTLYRVLLKSSSLESPERVLQLLFWYFLRCVAQYAHTQQHAYFPIFFLQFRIFNAPLLENEVWGWGGALSKS